jgi:type I restriction enzyme M protein
MTQGELESYLDKAADILRGNADHSEFRGYVFALLFYKRISDCYRRRGPHPGAIPQGRRAAGSGAAAGRDPQNHHFVVPEAATGRP